MNIQEIWPLALSVLLMGMAKGGFPVGPLALQMIVLLWPGEVDPARTAVGFMLPMLCAMDICAVTIYRKQIDWRSVLPVIPWAVLGVAIATPVFLAKGTGLAVPDKAIKLCIGLVGLFFVLYQVVKKRILDRLESGRSNSIIVRAGVGVSSGIVSTIAHAAGPIVQMYLLPRGQPKQVFVASMAAFFFVLNYVKLVPFLLTGTIRPELLKPMLVCLPFIPLGVLMGYFAVKVIPQKAYIVLIYSTLFLTSVRLTTKVLFE
jgi:uncharacterized membrane protein YfcA